MKTMTALAATAVALLALTGCAAPPAPEIAYIEEARASLAAEPSAVAGNADGAALAHAGHRACDQMSQGSDIADVRVLTDDAHYIDDEIIARAAIAHLCPDA